MDLLHRNQEKSLNLHHLSGKYSSLLRRFANLKLVDNNSLRKSMENIDLELLDLDAKEKTFQKKVFTPPSKRSVARYLHFSADNPIYKPLIH